MAGAWASNHNQACYCSVTHSSNGFRTKTQVSHTRISVWYSSPRGKCLIYFVHPPAPTAPTLLPAATLNLDDAGQNILCVNTSMNTSVKTANSKPVDISCSAETLLLHQGPSRAIHRVPAFNLRGIPFLVYVEPFQVEAECLRLGCSITRFHYMSFYFAVLISLAQQAERILGQKRDAYPVIIPRNGPSGTF